MGNMGYGVRLSAIATSSTGRQSGNDVDVLVGLIDASAVLKFMSEPEKFQYGAGLSLGAPILFSIVVKQGTTSTPYTAPAQPVARAFVLGRFNFGRFALHGEGGYLYAKAPEFKNEDVKLTRADGSAVDLDLSGAYISLGFGFQF
jgi:hypothetical protein